MDLKPQDLSGRLPLTNLFHAGRLRARAGGFPKRLRLWHRADSRNAGRSEEGVAALRKYEGAKPWRLGRLYLISLRALLEGKREESLQTSEELMSATFRDPEGMFYLARQLSYLGAHAQALDMLARAVNHGFFCYPAFVRDPWLDALRGMTEFSNLIHKTQALQLKALRTFQESGRNTLLGVRSE